VHIKLTNLIDDELMHQGQLAPEQVHNYEADALVDAGAVCTALPVDEESLQPRMGRENVAHDASRGIVRRKTIQPRMGRKNLIRAFSGMDAFAPSLTGKGMLLFLHTTYVVGYLLVLSSRAEKLA
jgi:hypothetical protein